MKLSVSLTDDDLAIVDEYARTTGLPSRSAVVQRALRLLRAAELETQYDAAFAEWEASGDAEMWDQALGDGNDAPR